MSCPEFGFAACIAQTMRKMGQKLKVATSPKKRAVAMPSRREAREENWTDRSSYPAQVPLSVNTVMACAASARLYSLSKRKRP